MTTPKRDESFDAFRAVAILCVVAIHALALTVTDECGSQYVFWISVFLRQLITFAVPAFLFISGYFCAGYNSAENEYLKFLKKRVPKVLVPYVVWSLVIIILIPVFGGNAVLLGTIPKKLFLGTASGPYYFIPLIVCLYMLTPLLIRLVQAGGRGFWMAFLINGAALLIFYQIRVYQKSVQMFPWYLAVFSWFIHFAFGIYLGRNKTQFDGLTVQKKLWIGISVLLLFLSVVEAWFIVAYTGSQSFAVSASKFTTLLFSISIMLTFLAVRVDIKSYPNWLLKVGDGSFGIYLIHMILMTQLYRILERVDFFRDWPLILAVALFVLTTVLCMLTVALSRKFMGRKISAAWLGL